MIILPLSLLVIPNSGSLYSQTLKKDERIERFDILYEAKLERALEVFPSLDSDHRSSLINYILQDKCFKNIITPSFDSIDKYDSIAIIFWSLQSEVFTRFCGRYMFDGDSVFYYSIASMVRNDTTESLLALDEASEQLYRFRSMDGRDTLSTPPIHYFPSLDSWTNLPNPIVITVIGKHNIEVQVMPDLLIGLYDLDEGLEAEEKQR